MSIPEHIATILPRVLGALSHGAGMSDQGIPYTELWRDGECSFILAGEDFRRLVGNTQRLARFRALWSQYRESLTQPFGTDRSEDEAIRSKVDEAFDALTKLAEEGK